MTPDPLFILCIFAYINTRTISQDCQVKEIEQQYMWALYDVIHH
uniref:Uncharacterized protein n=1 Tax=Anguilla anguilla TaxID=7936 RepID=A0A0E9V3F2_ANGAN